MFGFLNINKPAGPTSHDIVYGVRRLVGKEVKVGHAGTLDPFAQGVLIVCLGGACRLASLVMGQDKVYAAKVTLGARSNTDDPTGEIAPTAGASAPAEQQVREVLPRFVGNILQTPPSHSAILVDGLRAYKIARAGDELNLPARPATIHSIELCRYEWPDLEIDVRCACGTYIRALARDIGEALGVGGYCKELIRTASGAFTLETAVAPERLNVERDLISPLVSVEHLPKVRLTQEQVGQVLLGQRPQLGAATPAGELAVLDHNGVLLALGTVQGETGTFQPDKVLVNTHKQQISNLKNQIPNKFQEDNNQTIG